MSRASIERSLSFVSIPFLNRFTWGFDLKVFSLLFMGGETDTDQSLYLSLVIKRSQSTAYWIESSVVGQFCYKWSNQEIASLDLGIFISLSLR